ncbi:MAG: cyclase family protein, partial [Schwartzia sp.]|nr:cyclase family protein [Schwartzia sp. (in: firmicutes)]
MNYRLWEILGELRSDAFEWVDLTHLMDNSSPYWSGIPDGSVELGKTCFDWGNEMLDCLIQTFKFPGQFGTHIDFPGHFIKNAPLSEKYGVRDMICPLCVIDVTEKVKKDVHYAATAADIKEYEAKYGDIPDGAFVALRTDWS